MNDGPKWKSIAAAVLIVLGCILATVSVAVLWLNQVVLDTDSYVETVAPLSEDAAIKDAVAAKVTDEMFQRTHAQQLAKQALPDQLDFLAAPIVGATQGFVDEQIRSQLDSAEFTKIWKDANRRAQTLMRQILLNEQGAVSASDGTVSIDLSGLVDIAKARLDEKGITIFDDVSLQGAGPELTVFQSQSVTSAQSAVSLLSHLAFWLPLAALAFFAIGAWLSRSAMAALLWIGLGLASGMVALLVCVSTGRGYYLDSIVSAGSVDVPAATSFFDIIMASLKSAIRNAFVAGLLVAAVGFSLSPYAAATKLRASIWRIFRAAEDRGAKIDIGPAGSVIVKQKPALRAAGVVVALVMLIAMDQPTLSWAALVVLVLLIYIGALEFLARKAA